MQLSGLPLGIKDQQLVGEAKDKFTGSSPTHARADNSPLDANIAIP